MPRSTLGRTAARGAAVFVLGAATYATFAGDGIRTERVRFAKGATSAAVEGTLRGDESVDYVLGAAKGQSLNVSLATKNGATYFNILAPGQAEEPLYIGSVNGNQYEGVLPASGDYRIRVYMMRSAARRNEVAKYRLEIAVSGSAHAAATAHAGATRAVAAGAVGAAGAAKPASQPHFDATGQVPCARHRGQPTTACNFGVTRRAGGDATIVVTHPDGFRRTIYFARGRAVGADASQADGAFRAQQNADLNLVSIGDERYEMPDAAVSGG